jgi:hypothetical protein
MSLGELAPCQFCVRPTTCVCSNGDASLPLIISWRRSAAVVSAVSIGAAEALEITHRQSRRSSVIATGSDERANRRFCFSAPPTARLLRVRRSVATEPRRTGRMRIGGHRKNGGARIDACPLEFS